MYVGPWKWSVGEGRLVWVRWRRSSREGSLEAATWSGPLDGSHEGVSLGGPTERAELMDST